MNPIARSRSLRRRIQWVSAAPLVAPTLTLAQESPFLTGATALQTNIVAWMTPVAIIVENCGNTLILRCSGGENGGTSQYASRLIGDREMLRRQRSRGQDGPGLFLGAPRRSVQVSEQRIVEPALLAAQVEQLPDLSGYLKTASSPVWHPVRIGR